MPYVSGSSEFPPDILRDSGAIDPRHLGSGPSYSNTTFVTPKEIGHGLKAAQRSHAKKCVRPSACTLKPSGLTSSDPGRLSCNVTMTPHMPKKMATNHPIVLPSSISAIPLATNRAEAGIAHTSLPTDCRRV